MTRLHLSRPYRAADRPAMQDLLRAFPSPYESYPTADDEQPVVEATLVAGSVADITLLGEQCREIAFYRTLEASGSRKS